jgi:hypothetical protein
MKTIIKGNLRFEVNSYYDEADNPRNDCNLGRMFFLHQKYIIGDKHNYSGNDFSSWEEVKEFIEEDDVVVILPVYMYDHSAITISTESFHCRWDSGQIGYIYATKEDVLNEFKEITEEVINKVISILKEEVNIYDKYLNGEVYQIEVFENEEEVDYVTIYGYSEKEEFINQFNNQ